MFQAESICFGHAVLERKVMHELGFDVTEAAAWFPHEAENPFVLVRVSQEDAEAMAARVQDAFRRCYLTDAELLQRVQELEGELGGTPEERQRQIIASKLPNPGPIMSGDFGEIVVYFYQAVDAYPQVAFGPKKWRLKESRTHSAPYSDVLHFVLSNWPQATAQDEVFCSEVKTKATDGGSTPILSAIEGCQKDRISRLANTLNWLRDRAIGENLGAISIAQLNRFINANDYPPAIRRFRAVAVICESLIEAELDAAPANPNADFTLVIIVVPNLHTVYTEVFQAVTNSNALEGNDA